jgi:hypothetical protein
MSICVSLQVKLRDDFLKFIYVQQKKERKKMKYSKLKFIFKQKSKHFD